MVGGCNSRGTESSYSNVVWSFKGLVHGYVLTGPQLRQMAHCRGRLSRQTVKVQELSCWLSPCPALCLCKFEEHHRRMYAFCFLLPRIQP